jgi:molybdopterin/thiamine biosynthesis adenylyltransferase
VDAASASLRLAVPDVRIEAHPTHVLPQNAVELMSRYDVVLEGADNFATKFLCADAAKAAKRPIVQASAVRWYGTALAVGPLGGPCYRCIFEDLPEGGGPNCSDAGVMAPVVGVIAAVQADLAISILHGARVFGTLATFDGKALIARRRSVEPRPGCALCGSAPSIRGVDSARYVTASREHRSKRAC